MNSKTHVFCSRTYRIDEDVSPPDDYVELPYNYGLGHYGELESIPWEFLSMSTISGHAPGILTDGRHSLVVVMWARKKSKKESTP